MYKIWQILDIKTTLIGLHVGLALIAFMIHFILLSTPNYNWLDGDAGMVGMTSSAEIAPLPPGR